jgi:membrane protein DedA with SNARE-associated domain
MKRRQAVDGAPFLLHERIGSMTLPQLVAEHGYLAVFAGSLLEGETILILAGFAAHQGYLSLPWVMAVAFTGGTLGDQIFFYVGRRWGSALLSRLPRLERSAQRVRRLLLRHHAGLIVGVRFMYGLRIIGPIVIGMADVPAARFLAFNLIGAGIWSVAIAGAGFVFGQTLQGLLADADRYEGLGAGLIILIALLVGVVHLLRAPQK